MEAAQRSAEYVFQGIMYYFRREKVCPRYQFTLKDPVDPALLQQALDAALEAAPYYRVRLVWEKRRATTAAASITTSIKSTAVHGRAVP